MIECLYGSWWDQRSYIHNSIKVQSRIRRQHLGSTQYWELCTVDKCSRCHLCPTHIVLALTFPVHADNFLTPAAETLCLRAFSSCISRPGPPTKGRQEVRGKTFPWEQPSVHCLCMPVDKYLYVPCLWWEGNSESSCSQLPRAPQVNWALINHSSNPLLNRSCSGFLPFFVSLPHVFTLPRITSWVKTGTQFLTAPFWGIKTKTMEKRDKEVKELKVLVSESFHCQMWNPVWVKQEQTSGGLGESKK